MLNCSFIGKSRSYTTGTYLMPAVMFTSKRCWPLLYSSLSLEIFKKLFE